MSDLEKVINTNKYIFRNSGFIFTFVMQIAIIVITILSPDMSAEQSKIYDSALSSSFIYQMCYLTNNAADFAVKMVNIKKG
tara:strand:+ start:197 stop:439 length:243 start_codon:yes stop_codon:yes gene_type:complete